MKTIDLTYPIHSGMFKYPSDPEISIVINPSKIEEIVQPIYDESGMGSGAGINDKKYKSGYWLLNIRNHHGTHIDAPAHKIQGGKTIDCYNFNKFINESVLIDLTSTDLLKRKEREIRIEDIKDKIDSDNFVGSLIVYTGFCDKMREYEGRLKGDDKINFEKTFPYFSQDAAKYIVNKFPSLDIAGIDSFAFDPSGSNSEVHRIFFEKDIILLETLFNLGELKSSINKTFELYSVPLNYLKSDAAQTRAYAVIK